MLGDSALLRGGSGGEGGGSGDVVAAVTSAAAPAGTTTVGSNSGDEERGRIDEGERSFGGNRWPRQETLALLRIRSDMDVAFRDASVKGPLWEEVSRKLAELGYHRNAKKCKEKFENVYKYHKRTKEGRTGKSDGKTYRFFDQLEALENHPPIQSPNPSKPPPPPSLVVTTTTTTTTTTNSSAVSSLPIPTTVPMPPPPQVANTTTTTTTTVPHVTVPSTTTLPIAMPQGIAVTTTTPPMNLTIPSYPSPTNLFPTNPTPHTTIPISFPNIPTDLLSNSTSSSTSSDETLEGRRKRKRKWKDFFERLMKEVIEKQEDLQKRFLEAIEKREHDRMVREEAWRVQEMQRINREREILAQERSIAAAKDAAVMSFLQKIAEQQNLGQALTNINMVQPQPVSQPIATPPPPPQSVQQQQPPPPVALAQPVMSALVPQQVVTNMEIVKAGGGGDNGENLMGASSSRWPKMEVEALIKLRTNLDAKYQENGPKGPLWEEISSSMRKLGYNRNAKRCKEKWENINKYFKKVKESNKKRPEDSKTCPYFHQLDALYREKNKLDSPSMKPENMGPPLMVRPEQQWPPQQDVTMEDVERHHHHDDNEDDRDGEEEEEEEDDDEEDEGSGGGGNYEIVASKPAAAATASAE